MAAIPLLHAELEERYGTAPGAYWAERARRELAQALAEKLVAGAPRACPGAWTRATLEHV